MATFQNEEKKGFGPALAALILGIVSIVITGLIALIFGGGQMKALMAETLQETITSELGSFVATTPDEIAAIDTAVLIMKIMFGAIFFGAGLFMLISFICGIVAVCKYCGNKCETKVQSVIVLALIGLALVLLSIIIAVICTNDYSAIIDKVMAPYYG